MCFIVPRQFLSMGDGQRRSCDACEAFGSTCKQIIRNNTCRRRASGQLHSHRSANGAKLWHATFKRGYVEQTFRRVCVRAELMHGQENQAYLQRADQRLLKKGKIAPDKAKSGPADLTVSEAINAPWVMTKEAALAVWS